MTKTIFITGASSGIGLASAKLFFEKGWNVVATMRSPSNDKELKLLDPTRILVLRLDLQDLSSITPAVDAAIEKFGTIDLLLNNAGYGQTGLFETLSREQIQDQFDVNIFGLMDITRALLPHMRDNKGGGIINVSSGAGICGYPMLSIYCASKFALEGFTEALAFELASQNIFVKSVIPYEGVTSTNFISRAMGLPTPKAPAASYGAFIEKMTEEYGKIGAEASISSGDVADVIYSAATDGTDKLRYFIGRDVRGYMKARYESQSDEEYIAYVRSSYK